MTTIQLTKTNQARKQKSFELDAFLYFRNLSFEQSAESVNFEVVANASKLSSQDATAATLIFRKTFFNLKFEREKKKWQKKSEKKKKLSI